MTRPDRELAADDQAALLHGARLVTVVPRLAAEALPLSEGQKRRLAELFAPAVSAVVKR